ncbi:MAG: hypothetical protein WBZ36_08590 [Candidatus Nitrosopolaris sp.]
MLIQQPEVDPKRISIIGHSEGTFIAPGVAIDNPTQVKNIVLIGAVAQTERQLLYFQVVSLPLLYAEKVLDHNRDGLISIQQIAKTPLLTELLVPSFARLDWGLLIFKRTFTPFRNSDYTTIALMHGL